MKLTDMKRTASDAKKESEVAQVDQSKYPWGLDLRLDTASLKKLGIKKLPPVGTKMKVVAMGTVESASENKRRGGNNDRNVTIQLEKLHVGKASAASAEDAVDEAVADT